jgi:hypothetical protein
VAISVLTLRPCGHCLKSFLYCRRCEPGRRYCEACSGAARKERERKARQTYRSSKEGREQHRDEEERRREKIRMGDRRSNVEGHRLQMPRSESERADARSKSADWWIVAWPGLVAAAGRMLGTWVVCPSCGCHGRILRVISLDDWLEYGRAHRAP